MKMIGHSFDWIFRPLIGQSFDDSTHMDSMRFLMLIWLIFVFIVGNVYKSNLMAMLVSPKLHFPFETVDKMVDQTEMPFTYARGAILDNFLQDFPKGSVFRKIYEGAIKQKVNNVTEIILRVVSGEFAYLLPRTTLLSGIAIMKQQNLGKCDIYLMKQGFLQGLPVALTFPKKSPLILRINQLIIRLYELGILGHLIQQHIRAGKDCILEGHLEAYSIKLRPLEFTDFAGVFILYVAGLETSTDK